MRNITVRNDTDYELDIAQELGLSPDVKLKKTEHRKY